MIFEKVGIKTAASIATTAITITSSTTVNPFCCFFIFGSAFLFLFGLFLWQRGEVYISVGADYLIDSITFEQICNPIAILLDGVPLCDGSREIDRVADIEKSVFRYFLQLRRESNIQIAAAQKCVFSDLGQIFASLDLDKLCRT